jgi:RNA ligase (TIGR02306 family)
MERKLASIQKIASIRPIEGADAIEVARINNWDVVVKKNEFEVGAFCVYFEIDSFLPIREEFEFLRKSSFKKMGDQEGFRLKTIRLRGQVSQGLVVPIDILNGEEEMQIGISQQPHGDQLQLGPYDNALVIEEGVDVSELLGVIKYEPPIPAELAGKVKGSFPGFLRKTDEERVQNLTQFYDKWVEEDLDFYVTEKLDGSSATYYYNNGVFGVCSRNLELAEPEAFVAGMVMCDDGIERPRQQNSFWKVAQELGLKEKLEAYGRNISIQGELIGEGIQGNPYKIKGQTVRFFNVFDIDTQEYYGLPMFLATMQIHLKLETVPILTNLTMKLPTTIDACLSFADGKSVLNPDFNREGLVIRSMDRKISFKAISNKFLLGEK